MLPEIYNDHLTTYLKKSEYLILLIVRELVQVYRKVRLEEARQSFSESHFVREPQKKIKAIFRDTLFDH